MKRTVIIMISFMAFMLSGCGKNSEKDYNDFSNEIAELQSKVSYLESIQSEENTAEENTAENEKQVYEEKSWDFSFDYDDNNSIEYTLSIDADGNIVINGAGYYEDGKLGLAQSDRQWINENYFQNVVSKEIKISFYVGENEYEYVISNEQIISDTLPIEESVIYSPETREYFDNGVMEEHQKEIIELYDAVTSYLLKLPIAKMGLAP